MNKILVEVYVPSANLTFDVHIPLESKISEVAELLAEAIKDLSDNKYKKGGEVTICDFSTGKQYNNKLRIFETNIKNGSKIMLV